MLSVDKNPRGAFHNRLYAVAVHGTSVVLFWSADEGRTWKGPNIVRDAPPASPDQESNKIVFNPCIAVNRDGVVAVTWGEGTRLKKSGFIRSWTYRITASWDGGQTFSESLAVSSEDHQAIRFSGQALIGSTRRNGPDRQLGSVSIDAFADSGGHTFGLTAAADGVFHAAWTDNRTGVPQVWTAAVHAKRTGTPSR